MKLSIRVLVLVVATLALGGLARAADAKSESKPAKCCANAKAEGKECTHSCCTAAAEAGKACEKCGGTNPKAG